METRVYLNVYLIYNKPNSPEFWIGVLPPSAKFWVALKTYYPLPSSSSELELFLTPPPPSLLNF